MCNQQAGGGEHTIINSDIGELLTSPMLIEPCELTQDRCSDSLHRHHVYLLILERLHLDPDHARISRRTFSRD